MFVIGIGAVAFEREDDAASLQAETSECHDSMHGSIQPPAGRRCRANQRLANNCDWGRVPAPLRIKGRARNIHIVNLRQAVSVPCPRKL